MKSILITGSTGFIGKNLISSLDINKYDLILPKSNDLDLTKESSLNKLFESKRVDIVINLAADVGGINYIKKNHGKIFYNNALINLHLLEYSRKNKVKKYINLNTINCYPNTELNLTEDIIWDGFPNKDVYSYSLSKRISLAQSLAYKDQYNFDSLNLIIDNTYGPYDNFNLIEARVIPALIVKFQNAIQNKKNSVEIWGTGNSERQFLFVEDLVRIIKYLAENNNFNHGIFNLSSGETITIKLLSEKIAKMMNYNGHLSFNKNMPEGTKRRILDSSSFYKLIPNFSFTTLDDGIFKTIEWYNKSPK